MAIGVNNLHNLPIYDNAAPDNPKNGKDDDKRPFYTHPFIEIEPDKKTEHNTSGHGQAQLHDQLEIFHPRPILFIAEPSFVLSAHFAALSNEAVLISD